EEAFYATTAEEAPMTMAAPAVPQATEASLDAENSAPKNISLADLAARVRAAANSSEPPAPEAVGSKAASMAAPMTEGPAIPPALAGFRDGQPSAALRQHEQPPMDEPALLHSRPVAAAVERMSAPPVAVEPPHAQQPAAVIPEPANTQSSAPTAE